MSAKIVYQIIGIGVALAGLGLLLASPGLSEGVGSAILARHGGSLDTTVWLAEVQATTSAYRIIGGILLGVGLFRALQR